MDENNYLEKVRKRFETDRFATKKANITVEEAAPHHAFCRMAVTPEHKNSAGAVMGGAVFTLCDFAFAVASNGVEEPETVTLSANISFIAKPKGETLTAKASLIKKGGTVCFYEATVFDAENTAVAKALFTGYRPFKKVPGKKDN